MDGAELKYFKHCVETIEQNISNMGSNRLILHALEKISDPQDVCFIDKHKANQFYPVFQNLNLSPLLENLETQHPACFEKIQRQLAEHNKSVIFTTKQIGSDSDLFNQLSSSDALKRGTSTNSIVKKRSSAYLLTANAKLNKEKASKLQQEVGQKFLLENTRIYYSQNKRLLAEIGLAQQKNDFQQPIIVESPAENYPEIEIQNPAPEKDSQLPINPQTDPQPELSILDAADQEQIEQPTTFAENQETADEPQQQMIIEDSTPDNPKNTPTDKHELTNTPDQAQQDLMSSSATDNKEEVKLEKVPQPADLTEHQDPSPEQTTTPELPQLTPSAIETPQVPVINEQKKQEPAPTFPEKSAQPKLTDAPKHKEEKVASTSFYKQLFLGLGSVGTLFLIFYCCSKHCDKETLVNFFSNPQYALTCLRRTVLGMAI